MQMYIWIQQDTLASDAFGLAGQIQQGYTSIQALVPTQNTRLKSALFSSTSFTESSLKAISDCMQLLSRRQSFLPLFWYVSIKVWTYMSAVGDLYTCLCVQTQSGSGTAVDHTFGWVTLIHFTGLYHQGISIPIQWDWGGGILQAASGYHYMYIQDKQ